LVRWEDARCVPKDAGHSGRYITPSNLQFVSAAAVRWNPFRAEQHLSQTDLELASWFGCPRRLRLVVTINGGISPVTICR